MPNGGTTPDCISCKHFRRHPVTKQEPFCTLHNMKLAFPIRAFCASFVHQPYHRQELQTDGGDWLDRELDREELQTDIMYVWLECYAAKFLPVPLAPITEYQHWTSEEFLEELRKLRMEYCE